MPKYRHFLFITNNHQLSKDIAIQLWNKNKSWCVASTDNIYDHNVKKFMNTDDYKLILLTKPDVIVEKKVNDFIRFCEKHQVLPIFITTTDTYNDDITHVMYSNIEDVLVDSFEYIHNPKDTQSYKEMLNILLEYLW